jgi:predicted glycogen debranching enzyme
MTQLKQFPSPGSRHLRHQGDTVTFTLNRPVGKHGQAWLRTNIGHARENRQETIALVNHSQARLGQDWFDLPMPAVDENTFQLVLPLVEVGHFGAKAFFLPEGSREPQWPNGDNTILNVEPAIYCCGNSVYNAFVRQFGANLERRHTPQIKQEALDELDASGYAVIPASGTFRQMQKHLDFIIGTLGCRIIQLLPINPTPTVYARMGRFGSPYAALDFTAVDPALAEFSCQDTPLDQFQEFVDAVHARDAQLVLDIAINHTGWAAKIHETHPEWLVHDPDGSIHSPGAWGTVWEDLTELNHKCQGLWKYLAEVFLTWCRRGVDGFRCDAGYMIPLPAWQHIVATVRNEFPETLFLLEGLGGPTKTTEQLLDVGNLNWAYSELFQNYTREQIQHYLPYSIHLSATHGLMVNFAETHDNPRLAAHSVRYAQLRTALAALCSQNGAFGFANGVEWLATEKIDVHDSSSLNWNSSQNQVEHIKRLNTLLKIHPTFHPGTQLKLIQQGPGNCLALLRHHPATKQRVLVLANLDDVSACTVTWSTSEAGLASTRFIDLLAGTNLCVTPQNNIASLQLAPAEVLCLTDNAEDLETLETALTRPTTMPEQTTRQLRRTLALKIFQNFRGVGDLSGIDPDELAHQLVGNPLEYCRHLNQSSQETRVITWTFPRDLKRQVMIPPGHLLYVVSPQPFRVTLSMQENGMVLQQANSLRQDDGRHFTLLTPPTTSTRHLSCTLKLAVFEGPDCCQHRQGTLLALAATASPKIQHALTRRQLLDHSYTVLDTNGRGGMLRANAAWGKLESRYDALLAANPNPNVPVDRLILLRRCRAWVVYQGYSTEINLDCLANFHRLPNSQAEWRFSVPVGLGKSICLRIRAGMLPGENAVRLVFQRLAAPEHEKSLDMDRQVTLIVRPDVDERNFHEVTKAYLGAEKHWPHCIHSQPNGFSFTPQGDHQLLMTTSEGHFTREPEWHYAIQHSIEAERGLDPCSDLFSPGYFTSHLDENQKIILEARLSPDQATSETHADSATMSFTGERSLLNTLDQAMRHYVVKRDQLKTVIAGYPWFLDWGRDTLICARGMIAAGMLDEVRDILCQFARFEENGTLPNMIRGDDAGNRDTSDAPLWFFVACRDLVQAEGDRGFLQTSLGERTIAEVLESIARGYLAGTYNGIKVDENSGLVFSPPHFTWMDTNYPAGTPRQGYPIEIQALWQAALRFLSEFNPDPQWSRLADLVRSSITQYFLRPDLGYLSDCLHAAPGQVPAEATADDALRPNQLFAITLGAVTDTDIVRGVLQACEELLIPGAIRSLADRPVKVPLPIERDGHLLNDPHRPYWGRYEGPEDERRKPAYHNGTAWTWPFSSYAEAWLLAYGDAGTNTALAWLQSSTELLNLNCLGQIPEIIDADYPHQQRGCDAQAWGVTELYRVLAIAGTRHE